MNKQMNVKLLNLVKPYSTQETECMLRSLQMALDGEFHLSSNINYCGLVAKSLCIGYTHDRLRIRSEGSSLDRNSKLFYQARAKYNMDILAVVEGSTEQYYIYKANDAKWIKVELEE